MQNTFSIRKQGHYNLRNIGNLIIPKVKSVNFSFESIRYLGPKIWDSLPQSLKNTESVDSFKTAIKTWKPDRCRYVLVGFVKLICKTLDTGKDKRIIFIRFLSVLSIFFIFIDTANVYTSESRLL